MTPMELISWPYHAGLPASQSSLVSLSWTVVWLVMSPALAGAEHVRWCWAVSA
jgi:hypothetical protein